MFIQIANMDTGEVVEAATSFPFAPNEVYPSSYTMKCIRGYVRQWCKDGDEVHVLKCSSQAVHKYVEDYIEEVTFGDYQNHRSEN